MLPKHPDQLTDSDLNQWIKRLVDSKEPECIVLDYKQQINLASQKDRRELAKDLTSFANEIGGVVIYGVPEDRSPENTAPVPKSPYGLDPEPGIAERIENIMVGAIAPLLPSYRIRTVPLSDYPGKVCHIVWVPESWAGPHMVHGYSDGRFYRRVEFRSAVMTERDVEERYRRRIQYSSAAATFSTSEEATHLKRFFGRILALTNLTIVPMLLVPYRINFADPALGTWLQHRSTPHWRPWVPSMNGVRTGVQQGTGKRNEVEAHRNGAITAWRYTAVTNPNNPPLILYQDEREAWGEVVKLGATLYEEIHYSGPLQISITISCPEGYAIHLDRGSKPATPLEPSGTSIHIHIEPSAQDLIADQTMIS